MPGSQRHEVSYGHYRSLTLPAGSGIQLAGGRFLRSYPYQEAYLLDRARQFRAALTLPLILLGGITGKQTMDLAMAEGFAFVALARALLREPDLILRMHTDPGVRSLCIHCNKCMPTIYRGTHCVLAAATTALAAAIFAACGVYQLTPAKDRCLAHCRSPLGFVVKLGGYRGRTRDLRVGLYHGAFCLGCCWALMALLVAFGLMNVLAMVVLAVAALVEKTWAWGTCSAVAWAWPRSSWQLRWSSSLGWLLACITPSSAAGWAACDGRIYAGKGGLASTRVLLRGM